MRFFVLDIDKINILMDELEIDDWKELAKRASIPYTTLLYMLDGHSLYVKNALKLAEVFGVPLDDIIEKNCEIEVVNEKGYRKLKTDDIMDTACVNNLYLNSNL